MSRPRYLILAAGVGYRWHDYLDHPKHLLRMDGETVLGRTVRQLTYRGCDTWVIGPDDPRYRMPGATLWTPPNVEVTGVQVDKFLSSRPVWNPDGPTVFLWGDVWWSDEAINALTAYTVDSWRVWLRPGASRTTGAETGEMFAHYCTPGVYAAEEAACARVVDLHARGLIPWLNTGGWGHYRAMLGLSDHLVHGWVDEHTGLRHVTVVDDWTDDFDQPGDYVTWYGRRAEGRYPARVVFDGASRAARLAWPALDDPHPAATVHVRGDLLIRPDQIWCGIAHAVEHGVPVVPYSHATTVPREDWEAQPMWTADPTDQRILITPTGCPDDADPVRLYGHCQEA